MSDATTQDPAATSPGDSPPAEPAPAPAPEAPAPAPTPAPDAPAAAAPAAASDDTALYDRTQNLEDRVYDLEEALFEKILPRLNAIIGEL